MYIMFCNRGIVPIGHTPGNIYRRMRRRFVDVDKFTGVHNVIQKWLQLITSAKLVRAIFNNVILFERQTIVGCEFMTDPLGEFLYVLQEFVVWSELIKPLCSMTKIPFHDSRCSMKRIQRNSLIILINEVVKRCAKYSHSLSLPSA